MADTKKVLLVGWNPDVVDFSKWPELNAEKLRKALNADSDSLKALGYETDQCFINDAGTAQNDVTAVLKHKPYDCVLIGAGVRKVDEHFLVFETLVNAVHQAAPSAKICFNTGPTDSVDAVKRWV